MRDSIIRWLLVNSLILILTSAAWSQNAAIRAVLGIRGEMTADNDTFEVLAVDENSPGAKMQLPGGKVLGKGDFIKQVDFKSFTSDTDLLKLVTQARQANNGEVQLIIEDKDATRLVKVRPRPVQEAIRELMGFQNFSPKIFSLPHTEETPLILGIMWDRIGSDVSTLLQHEFGLEAPPILAIYFRPKRIAPGEFDIGFSNPGIGNGKIQATLLNALGAQATFVADVSEKFVEIPLESVFLEWTDGRASDTKLREVMQMAMKGGAAAKCGRWTSPVDEKKLQWESAWQYACEDVRLGRKFYWRCVLRVKPSDDGMDLYAGADIGLGGNNFQEIEALSLRERSSLNFPTKFLDETPEKMQKKIDERNWEGPWYRARAAQRIHTIANECIKLICERTNARRPVTSSVMSSAPAVWDERLNRIRSVELVQTRR